MGKDLSSEDDEANEATALTMTVTFSMIRGKKRCATCCAIKGVTSSGISGVSEQIAKSSEKAF